MKKSFVYKILSIFVGVMLLSVMVLNIFNIKNNDLLHTTASNKMPSAAIYCSTEAVGGYINQF